MRNEEIAIKLEKKGVKATVNRILVYKIMAQENRPMSLSDLELALVSMDKSSIFRVLTLFVEHDVVHAFEDGRGVLHYDLCGSEGVCNFADRHIHFYCESCQKSFCLEDIPVPDMQLPEGYSTHSVSFVVKGECENCRKKNHHC